MKRRGDPSGETTPAASDRSGAVHAIQASEIEAELLGMADVERAAFLQRFFKTGPGEYAEGDRFLGIRVPELRRLARKFDSLDLKGCRTLLRSPYHEARLLALLILVRRYDQGDEASREAIYRLYMENTDVINNWDLVDASAEHIVGRHLFERDRSVLDELARSSLLWERRIAVIATFYFIRRGQFDDTLRLADVLLDDPHDLIHKGVGWMLREMGKRDQAVLEGFLRERYRRMPRTMLRYAIERFPEPLRQRYLRGEV